MAENVKYLLHGLFFSALVHFIDVVRILTYYISKGVKTVRFHLVSLSQYKCKLGNFSKFNDYEVLLALFIIKR